MEGTKEYWSMTEGVFNCLLDKDRTLAFKRAIDNTVRRGDIVVDMGTGTGILAMFAIDAGAKKVYAIENDEKNCRSLAKVFELNGYSDQIKVLEADARKVRIPEKVDTIIGEMIATGLIEELQIPAMNNILKYARKDVKVLLNSYEIYADLVFNENRFYGYTFEIPRYEYSDIKETWSKSYTGKIKYARVDFSKINQKNKINCKIPFTIEKNGIINGLRISASTVFYDGSTFEDSFAYSFPVIFPLDSTDVKKGDKFLLELSYSMCEGLKKFKYLLSKTNKKSLIPKLDVLQ